MSTAVRPTPTAADKIKQVSFGYLGASALNAIARLEIADLLRDKPLSVDELAKRTSTNKDALCRVLRLLCSIGIFEEVSLGTFSNNEASDSIRKDAPGGSRDLLLFMSDPFHMKAYADMLPTIRDGRPATYHVWGKDCFECFADDKEEQKLFDDAMTNLSTQVQKEIVDSYDFSGIDKLVDVAGGHGALLSAVLHKNPKMHGVVFELDRVVPGAVQYIKKENLSDRCEAVAGDIFKSVPTADAYIMKHVIHDWDDERAVTILTNCRQSLSKTGARKVLIVEMLMAGMNEAHMSKFLDIEMLMLPGGKERTEQEFQDLLQKAGLKINRIVRTKSPAVVIEAVPN